MERDDRALFYYAADKLTEGEFDYLAYGTRLVRKEGEYCYPGTTRFDHYVYVLSQGDNQ